MRRVILWAIGLVMGVPLAILTFFAFMLFVFYPIQNAWNVRTADARNERVWEEGIAHVISVEVDLLSEVGLETLRTDIVCYEGHYAKPWTLKSGAPTRGIRPTSIGAEALEADFPTGAVLWIELTSLCSRVFRENDPDLPKRLENTRMYVFDPEVSLYCLFIGIRQSENYIVHTDAARVERPVVVAINERPLNSVATLADLGSSETPLISSAFARKWGTGIAPSHWRDDRACWTGQAGVCSEKLTHSCGANPR